VNVSSTSIEKWAFRRWRMLQARRAQRGAAGWEDSLREERAIALDTTAQQISPERPGVEAGGHAGGIRVSGAQVPTTVDDAFAVMPASGLLELGKRPAELVARRRRTVAARETEHRLRPATRVGSSAAQRGLRIHHFFEGRRFSVGQAGSGRNATRFARAAMQESAGHNRQDQAQCSMPRHPTSIDIRSHLRNAEAQALLVTMGD
jgi:hypothetical protein